MQQDSKAIFKDIIPYVDALEANYEQRLYAMQQEYRQDVEHLLQSYTAEKHNYAIEKQNFNENTLKLEYQIEILNDRLSELMRLYQQEIVQHKFTKDNLIEHRKQIACLSAKEQSPL